jgi:hypothetical protein
MEQTAGPLPTDDVSHVVYLGEEAAPLFPLAEHCELPSISADVLKSILTEEQGYPAQSVVIVDSRHHFEYEGGHIKVHHSWITAAVISFIFQKLMKIFYDPVGDYSVSPLRFMDWLQLMIVLVYPVLSGCGQS